MINVLMYHHICSGSVYYYTMTGSYWSHQSKIVAQDGASNDYFGTSVSIYDTNAFIGANADDYKVSDTGMYIIIYI